MPAERSLAGTVAARPSHAVEISLLVLLAVLWGASYSFIRVGVETIPPVTLIAARTLIAGAVLWAILRWRGLHLPRDRTSWQRFFVQACLNSVVPFTLIAWAQRSVEAGLASILNATSPVFVFLIGLVLWSGGRFDPLKAVGVAAGLAGTAIIIGVDALQGLGGDLLPQLALVLASVCYAGAALFGRNFAGLDPLVPAAGSMICGFVLLLPFSMLVDRPWTLVPSQASLIALMGLALFSTAIAFAIYFRLLRTLGPVGTTSVAYLRVPMGVLIGVVVLGERLSMAGLAGMALVVAGVAAMSWRR